MNRLSDRSSLFLGVKGVNSGILEKFQINRDEGIGNFPSALSNDRFSSFAWRMLAATFAGLINAAYRATLKGSTRLYRNKDWCLCDWWLMIREEGERGKSACKNRFPPDQPTRPPLFARLSLRFVIRLADPPTRGETRARPSSKPRIDHPSTSKSLHHSYPYSSRARGRECKLKYDQCLFSSFN